MSKKTIGLKIVNTPYIAKDRGKYDIIYIPNTNKKLEKLSHEDCSQKNDIGD